MWLPAEHSQQSLQIRTCAAVDAARVSSRMAWQPLMSPCSRETQVVWRCSYGEWYTIPVLDVSSPLMSPPVMHQSLALDMQALPVSGLHGANLPVPGRGVSRAPQLTPATPPQRSHQHLILPESCRLHIGAAQADMPCQQDTT